MNQIKHSYLARAIEMDVVASPSSAFVFVKLRKLIFTGFIQLAESFFAQTLDTS